MERWSPEKINAWYAQQPWLAGANYVPSCAVNDVEMWRKDAFAPDVIRRELTWAREIGMNTMRVFLPYTVWQAEGEGFLNTFEEFLRIADDCGQRVLPILFDDCAFDGGIDPTYGPQPDPVPGVHNSRWVPSPGFALQDDPAAQPALRAYVHAVIGAHRDDPRIVAWDLYNEPGNTDRKLRCLPLVVNVFAWAREIAPSQPLCSCIWHFDPSWKALNDVIIELSDVVNLHTYGPQYEVEQLVAAAQATGRPVFITEWLHRPNGNGIMNLLPYFRQNKIALWQWGLVQGRTQTNLSWNTMHGGTPDANPALWQHDILLPDGTPYKPEEIALYRQLTNP